MDKKEFEIEINKHENNSVGEYHAEFIEDFYFNTIEILTKKDLNSNEIRFLLIDQILKKQAMCKNG